MLLAESRRLQPAGAAPNRMAGTTVARLTMGYGEDARAVELHNLRLALATFALQLDAFEMRANGALQAAGREPSIAVRRSNRLRESEGGT